MGIVCRVKPGLILLKELLLKKFTAKITAKFTIYAVWQKLFQAAQLQGFHNSSLKIIHPPLQII